MGRHKDREVEKEGGIVPNYPVPACPRKTWGPMQEGD